ncbi:response regulator transcription factor [Clostridium sp. Marseille-P299]|uniref:response regulator transcription factor n=1 Tax=Clostridium sp. Marseille-P299 TaxID=1805477 RepID=UPI000A3FAC99|nr:response regulator transcription factor [Clostridium sp. Marseille-P299]
MITVLLADDDGIIRDGLKMILEMQEDMEVVAIACDGEEAVSLARNTHPDVSLLDIRMPKMDGIDVADFLIKENLSMPLLLTTFDEEEFILRAINIGVPGYILKNSPAKRLLSAIRVLASGGTVFQKDIFEYIASQVNKTTKDNKKSIFKDLTERELEVASYVAKGFSNKEISNCLFISDGTVRNHISIILDKTGLEHRTQIAIEYIKEKGAF